MEGVGEVLVRERLAPEGGEDGSREEGINDPTLETLDLYAFVREKLWWCKEVDEVVGCRRGAWHKR